MKPAAAEVAEVVERYRRASLPPMTREAEREALARARTGDQRARDQLVRSTMLLVVALARKQRRGTVPLEEVVQEGLEGLTEAVDRFDLSRPVRFATYALWWARAHIGKYLKQARSVVRPRAGEVALGDLSLDAPLTGKDGDGEESHLERIPDEGALQDELHAAADHDARVRAALARLRSRLGQIGWDVVQTRLLRGEDADTLEQVGGRHGVSRERVRQVEAKAREVLARYLPTVGLGGDEHAVDAERARAIERVPGPAVHAARRASRELAPAA